MAAGGGSNRGRPAIDINQADLTTFCEAGYTRAELSAIFHVSAKTIGNRLASLGLRTIDRWHDLTGKTKSKTRGVRVDVGLQSVGQL